MLIQSRDQALREISRLAEKHNLGLDDIAAAITPGTSTAKAERNIGQIVIRILSYIGGLMVFAGLGIYTEMEWKNLSSLARVIITLGPGLVGLVMMLACLKDARFEKASTPLLLISALLQPTGLLVFLHEYFPPSPHPELALALVFLTMAAQQAILLQKFGRTLMLLLAIGFGFSGVGDLLYWLRADMAFSSVVLSFAGFCLTQAISVSRHRALVPWLYFAFGCGLISGLYGVLSPLGPNIFYVIIGGALALSVVTESLRVFTVSRPVTLFFAVVPYLFFTLGALDRFLGADGIDALLIGLAGFAVAYGLREGLQQKLTPVLYLVFGGLMNAGMYDLVAKTPFDVLLVGFGAGLMYVSVVLGSRMLLAVSVISLLGYLTYFTDRYFAHVVGWPVALIVLGLILMLISVYAVKLGQKITKTP